MEPDGPDSSADDQTDRPDWPDPDTSSRNRLDSLGGTAIPSLRPYRPSTTSLTESELWGVTEGDDAQAAEGAAFELAVRRRRAAAAAASESESGH